MEIELKLTDQQLQVVVAALGEMPYKISAPVLQAIQDQVRRRAEVPAKEGK